MKSDDRTTCIVYSAHFQAVIQCLEHGTVLYNREGKASFHVSEQKELTFLAEKERKSPLEDAKSGEVSGRLDGTV